MSTVDMDARMAAYRRQTGRSALTPRQMRRAMKKIDHQTSARRRRMVAALDVTGAKGGQA